MKLDNHFLHIYLTINNFIKNSLKSVQFNFRMNRIGSIWKGMPLGGKGATIASLFTAGCFITSHLAGKKRTDLFTLCVNILFITVPKLEYLHFSLLGKFYTFIIVWHFLHLVTYDSLVNAHSNHRTSKFVSCINRTWRPLKGFVISATVKTIRLFSRK